MRNSNMKYVVKDIDMKNVKIHWNSLIDQIISDLTKKFREEQKPFMNRAMRRAANKK
jgi:translation initiation factor IF-2